MQEREYEESLRRDRERELAKEKEEAEEADRKAAIAAQEAFDVQRELSAKDKLPDEPDADDPSAVKLQFRLPGGEKAERRFKYTDCLKNVIDFVHSEGRAQQKFAIFHIPRYVCALLTSQSATLASSLFNDHEFTALVTLQWTRIHCPCHISCRILSTTISSLVLCVCAHSSQTRSEEQR
jgi:hypothetical protein